MLNKAFKFKPIKYRLKILRLSMSLNVGTGGVRLSIIWQHKPYKKQLNIYSMIFSAI